MMNSMPKHDELNAKTVSAHLCMSLPKFQGNNCSSEQILDILGSAESVLG